MEAVLLEMNLRMTMAMMMTTVDLMIMPGEFDELFGTSGRAEMPGRPT